MNMHIPYSHRPVPVIYEDGQRECLRCTRPLAPLGDRHADELVPPMQLTPIEAAAIRSAVEVIEQALADMPTDRCTDLDRAQVAAEALHRRGMVIVRKRGRRSSSHA